LKIEQNIARCIANSATRDPIVTVIAWERARQWIFTFFSREVGRSVSIHKRGPIL